MVCNPGYRCKTEDTSGTKGKVERKTVQWTLLEARLFPKVEGIVNSSNHPLAHITMKS